MLPAFEVYPLRLHLRVEFQFGVGLYVLVAFGYVDGQEVVEEQCVDSLALIFGQNAHEHEVECVGLLPFHGFEQVEPPEWQQSPLGFLQGPRERWHRYSHTDEASVAVGDERHEFQVDEWQVGLHVLVDLAVAQLGVSKQRLEGFVYDAEYLAAILACYLFV